MLEKFLIAFINTEVKRLIIENLFKILLIFYKMMFQNLLVEIIKKEKKMPKMQVSKVIAESREEKRNKF